MLGAILFAQSEMKSSLELIEELVSQATITPIDFEVKEDDEELKQKIGNLISADLTGLTKLQKNQADKKRLLN